MYFTLLFLRNQGGSSSGSANIPETPDEIKKFVIEQRKGTSGLFRDDPWFPSKTKDRVYDFAKNPISVVLSSGYNLEGQGLIVSTPELYDASIPGEIDLISLKTGKLKNAVGEQRLLVYGYDEDGRVITVRSDLNDLASALSSKRDGQIYNGLSYVLEAWMTAEKWEQMVKVALTLLAEKDLIQAWWERFASFEGDSAPWNKRGHGKSPHRRHGEGGAASSAPTVSSANTPEIAPVADKGINAIVNMLARTDLNNAYFMNVEPERFTFGDNTLYAKRTPYMQDCKTWPTCEFPNFAREFKKVSRGDQRHFRHVRSYFSACFAVISLDGDKYFQATKQELQEDLRKTGIHDRVRNILRVKTYPDDTWRRVVNEKVRRLDRAHGKRKAADTQHAPDPKASKGATSGSAQNDDEATKDDVVIIDDNGYMSPANSGVMFFCDTHLPIL